MSFSKKKKEILARNHISPKYCPKISRKKMFLYNTKNLKKWFLV